MATQKIENNLIRKSAISLAAIFGLALGMISVPALAAAAHKPDSASTDVPVHMVVTVKARHGGQVPAVAPDDVKVYQRDKRDTVTSWLPLQGDRAGLQLFILIDDFQRQRQPAVQEHCEIHRRPTGYHRDRRWIYAQRLGRHGAGIN